MIPVLCLLVPLVWREAGPLQLPFERVRDNAQAWISEHPDDASGYELLGRLHVFVFVGGRDYVLAPWNGKNPVGLYSLHGLSWNGRRDRYPDRASRVAFRSGFWKDQTPWEPSASEKLDHVLCWQKLQKRLSAIFRYKPDAAICLTGVIEARDR